MKWNYIYYSNHIYYGAFFAVNLKLSNSNAKISTLSSCFPVVIPELAFSNCNFSVGTLLIKLLILFQCKTWKWLYERTKATLNLLYLVYRIKISHVNCLKHYFTLVISIKSFFYLTGINQNSRTWLFHSYQNQFHNYICPYRKTFIYKIYPQMLNKYPRL